MLRGLQLQLDYEKLLVEEKDQQAKAQEDLKKEGEAFTKSQRTASEVFGNSIQDMNRLLKAGVITGTTFDRGMAEAKEKFMKDSKEMKVAARIEFEILGLDALIHGSKEALAAFAKFREGAGGDQKFELSSQADNVARNVKNTSEGITGVPGLGGAVSAARGAANARLGGAVKAGISGFKGLFGGTEKFDSAKRGIQVEKGVKNRVEDLLLRLVEQGDIQIQKEGGEVVIFSEADFN